MAKVQIKFEPITPFGGIFSIMEQFDALLSDIIDSTLGLRCKTFGYQYSEIIRSLMCVCFCGGSCIEDISTHLINHLSLHPKLRTCSADTILRAIKELTIPNITYSSKLRVYKAYCLKSLHGVRGNYIQNVDLYTIISLKFDVIINNTQNLTDNAQNSLVCGF